MHWPRSVSRLVLPTRRRGQVAMSFSVVPADVPHEVFAADAAAAAIRDGAAIPLGGNAGRRNSDAAAGVGIADGNDDDGGGGGGVRLRRLSMSDSMDGSLDLGLPDDMIVVVDEPPAALVAAVCRPPVVPSGCAPGVM